MYRFFLIPSEIVCLWFTFYLFLLGVEYVLLHVDEPSNLMIIRKQERHSPSHVCTNGSDENKHGFILFHLISGSPVS